MTNHPPVRLPALSPALLLALLAGAWLAPGCGSGSSGSGGASAEASAEASARAGPAPEAPREAPAPDPEPEPPAPPAYVTVDLEEHFPGLIEAFDQPDRYDVDFFEYDALNGQRIRRSELEDWQRKWEAAKAGGGRAKPRTEPASAPRAGSGAPAEEALDATPQLDRFLQPVSYTHLTLPTIYSV